MHTEDALGLIVDGGEQVDGFEVGGLWTTTDYPVSGAPSAPVDLWPKGTTVDARRMHGPGWVVPLWRFRLGDWPQATAWEGLIQATLQELVANGASIAWMANEATFADPPSLFDPSVMGDSIFAALSGVTGFVCTAQLEQPIAWLPPRVQEKLRMEALRLVDFRLPDPDDWSPRP